MMNIQILPNWCKKLGVLLFLCGFMGGIFLFVKSLTKAKFGNNPYETGYNAGEQLYALVSGDFLMGISAGRVITGVTLLGMIVFLLSKEKVEDEYISKLRLESYQLTLLLVALFFLALFFVGVNISSMLSLYLFFGVYLLVFRMKKVL